MVSPIPAGYHSVTPYLLVKDAARALAYYREAFGAEELMREVEAWIEGEMRRLDPDAYAEESTKQTADV